MLGTSPISTNVFQRAIRDEVERCCAAVDGSKEVAEIGTRVRCFKSSNLIFHAHKRVADVYSESARQLPARVTCGEKATIG
jgi:hypothetical protein